MPHVSLSKGSRWLEKGGRTERGVCTLSVWSDQRGAFPRVRDPLKKATSLDLSAVSYLKGLATGREDTDGAHWMRAGAAG